MALILFCKPMDCKPHKPTIFFPCESRRSSLDSSALVYSFFRASMASSGNEYKVLEGDEWISIPEKSVKTLGFGRDYYVEIFRVIEKRGQLSNLRFYLSKETPEALPSYGDDVVLCVIGDEHFRCFPYFRDILAIIRCYGDRPRYLDGFPTDYLGLIALIFFLFKMSGYLRDLWKSTHFRRSLMRDIRKRTLHTPLGCFGDFQPTLSEFSLRPLDYAFLGSIDYRNHPWYSPLGILRPPKFIARTKMMQALHSLAIAHPGWKKSLAVTGGFADSIGKPATYAQAMADTKISVCPRGSNPDTYRFYESCKAGCVVVGEPIPAAWFLEKHPGVVIHAWRELPERIDELLKNPQKLESMSAASREFWSTFLAEEVVAVKMESFLSDLLASRKIERTGL